MSIMKYTTKIILYSSHFDINDRLSPKSILNIFQDVTAAHGEELGVGYKSMIDKNLYWVLSRIKLDIIKMPIVNQTVVVETWPQVKGRIDFDRDMKILSEDGELLIKATSKWCVIDTVKRMLQRTDNVNYDGEYCLDKNYEDKLNKIIMPNEKFEKKFVYVVKFSDLDHNKHMNNTNYANLVVNVLNNKIFNHFEINFINECLENDKICVCMYINENGQYISGLNGENIAFNAYVK